MHFNGSILLALSVLSIALWSPVSEASIINPSDVLVTQLELTGGSADYDGRFSKKLDRLFDRPGQLVMDDYQPIGDIVPSITKGHRTFSLFTSGFNGAPAPYAVIDGSSITVDLSSLFFGVSRGDHFKVWNVGGIATGTFNPYTQEFSLTWDHLFGNRHKSWTESFSLQGHLVTVDAIPVPLPATGLFFAAGFVVLMGVWRRWGDSRQQASAL